MEVSLTISAARCVIGSALGPVLGGLLESWAASSELGTKIRGLKIELLYAQGMLDNSHGKDIRSPALVQLLLELRNVAYKADDAIDELEYFRIQDELDGTYETIDNGGARGLVQGCVLNTRHTARALAGKLKLSPCLCAAAPHAPKLKFNRVKMSRKMTEITEELKYLCTKVSSILGLELFASSCTKAQTAPLERPKTTPLIIEPKIYGREKQIKNIVDEIIHGKYDAEDLTVLSVVGLGGIGKTTFAQHVYDKVKSHFQILIWICVSHDFNATILVQEIIKQVPKGADEVENGSNEELIGKRLQSKQFLLVLDDMWTCHEDEWKKLLAPFRKVGTKGNMVLVTTRIPEVAKFLGTTNCSVNLERLDPEDSMLLFQACVFGDQQQAWEDHADLHDVGRKIVDRLKGSPLAVKTVGRLLRSQLDREHWNIVLESKEWELQTHNNDIMPALNLSYNYLPFHLQQCFSHCSLFPEDYEFNGNELIHLWLGLGLLGTSDQNKRSEDIGLSYLNTLVNHGFFIKVEKDNNYIYYIIHDLLHELAVNVSSYECLTVHHSNVRSTQIPASVRHLSIIVDNPVVSDRLTFENFKRDLATLDKRLKAENLRTLMLFGFHQQSFTKIFADLFREAKALRVIFLSGASSNVEDLLHNFSNLVHLRYLSILDFDANRKATLASSISRFYHLVVLDIHQHTGDIGCVRDMGNLIKMRHFLVRGDRFHSDIFCVGKLKNLQELRRFEVKKEANGFELKQLGQLLELRGSLGIHNLERVNSRREGEEAKLTHMSHLNRLQLAWDMKRSYTDPKQEEEVLESLKPHNNIRKLCIQGHRGPIYPTWLGRGLSIANLELLRLEDVAWNMLPLVGRLCMTDEHGRECTGCVTGQGFQNLKRIALINIPRLRKWLGDGSCHQLSHLEELTVRDCFELTELPCSHSTCHETKEEDTDTPWFPKLHTLHISGCPNLLSLPPIPWTSTLCSAEIEGSLGFELLSYTKGKSILSIKRKADQDSTFWNMLGFSYLAELQSLNISNCTLSLDHLRRLASLKNLAIDDFSNILWPVEGERNDQYQFPVKSLQVHSCGVTGKEFTELLSHFPNLSVLHIDMYPKVTGLGVAEQHARTAPASSPSASADEIDEAKTGRQGEQETETAGAEGLLLLPPRIEYLHIGNCPEVSLRSIELKGLRSLHTLWIIRPRYSPSLLSSNSSSSSCCPFPVSLQSLNLLGVEGMLTLAPLTNVTHLCIGGNLRCDDLYLLLAHGQLDDLFFHITPKPFLEPSQLITSEHDLCRSSRLGSLVTDDIAWALDAPICDLFLSSLTSLQFTSCNEVERFTKEQEEALQTLTSLQEIQITRCLKLQSLPARISELPSLKRLCIGDCALLRSLPKNGLPSSLAKLEIENCPGIRSLPKGGLPSSLQLLDVSKSGNMELIRECRKHKGTIPIIIA